MSGGKKKLEMVPDFSPVKKKKKTFGNYIDVYDTKVSHFSVVIVTRADKCESPYMKPFVTAFEEDDSGELSKKWKILKIAARKGEKSGDGTYAPMPASPGSNFAWHAFIAYKSGPIVTAKALGNHITKDFNAFVNTSTEVRFCWCVQAF